MQARVLKLRLRQPNRWKRKRLEQMRAEYAACCAYHLEVVQRLETTNATKIHRETYQEAKRLFPNLPAVTLQTARDKAIAAQRGYLARKAKGKKARPPRFNGRTPLGLHQQALAIVERNGKFVLRLTTATRYSWIWLPLEGATQWTETLRGVAARTVKHGASELHQDRQGNWYLYLTIYQPDVPVQEGGKVFGLDLGVVNHAVLVGPGYVRFWSGRAARWRREYFAERRRQLAKAKLLREVRRTRGKERRWMRDVNHKLSRQIVNAVYSRGGTVICIERLLGIRERTKLTRKVNRMIHSWTFRELIDMIRYKAAALGIRVIEVDPRRTSRTCPRCGHVDAANRREQATFACVQCGYTANADYVAARNIAAKSMLAG